MRALLRMTLGVLVVVVSVQTVRAADAPRELGDIQWHRGFDASAAEAAKQNRPMLVLFQEVPGCSTCVNYGQGPLSHPLIVEAAETLFHPVAVFNNIDGADKTTLASFKEPSWNNPVVRVMTPDRKPLAPRLANDYSLAGLAGAMVAALDASDTTVPTWLQLLADEGTARRRGLEQATFVMHCFWEGEGSLGGLNGAITTKPGFVGGAEVVHVQFDPKVISYEKLLGEARKMKCASKVFTHNKAQQTAAAKVVGEQATPLKSSIRPDKTPKYYLANTVYEHIPMTETQAARVNSAIGSKRNPDGFLSPRQIALIETVRKHPSASWPTVVGTTDITRAWKEVSAVAVRVSGQSLSRK